MSYYILLVTMKFECSLCKSDRGSASRFVRAGLFSPNSVDILYSVSAFANNVFVY